MINRMLKGDKKTFLMSLFILSITISLVFLVATMLIQAENNRDKRLEVDISERERIASEEYFINYKIDRLTSDLQFINDTLQQNYPTDGDFSDIEKLLLSYSKSRRVYDQIRFINMQGDEIVRVDYSTNGAVVIPQNKLQNKKDRYYFQQTIELDKGQMYLSPLDLNVENDAIELPINPVIRLAQPFFDQNGIKRGIIILNYSASDVLEQIASIANTSFGSVFFLNNAGYWLFNSRDSYTEWAFSYNPESTVKFPNYFPNEWKKISEGGSGTITTANGYFCYTTIQFEKIHPAGEDGSTISCDIGNWYIMSYIPSASSTGTYPSNNLSNLVIASFQQYYLIYILIVLVSALLAGFATSSKSKSQQVKFFSEYDVMTNAYNRHAGIDKLSGMYKSIAKNGCILSICFIDVNGLKVVNDTLGHDVGDELIITVAKTIQAHIRGNDFLIRLGGDEFVIAFQGIDETLAETVWSRITTEFEAINNTEHRKYSISVSHGIKTLSCDLDQKLDSVLNQADVKMYDEKRRIKSNIQIIRE